MGGSIVASLMPLKDIFGVRTVFVFGSTHKWVYPAILLQRLSIETQYLSKVISGLKREPFGFTTIFSLHGLAVRIYRYIRHTRRWATYKQALIEWSDSQDGKQETQRHHGRWKQKKSKKVE